MLAEFHHPPESQPGSSLEYAVASTKTCSHPNCIEHATLLKAKPDLQVRGESLDLIEKMSVYLLAQLTWKSSSPIQLAVSLSIELCRNWIIAAQFLFRETHGLRVRADRAECNPRKPYATKHAAQKLAVDALPLRQRDNRHHHRPHGIAHARAGFHRVDSLVQ